MRLFPLVHSRSFHAAAKLPAIDQEPSKNGVRLKSDSSFSLLSDKARYVQKEQVYYNFEYEAERRRGLSWKEDLFCPGYFEIDIENDIIFSIMASTWRRSMPDVEEALEHEVSRLRGLKAPIRKLAQAADTFVVRSPGKEHKCRRPLVRRLGKRRHGLAARPTADDRALRRRQTGAQDLCCGNERGKSPQRSWR
jgi:glycogen debranching enzyme